jgi:hypothetical protein
MYLDQVEDKNRSSVSFEKLVEVKAGDGGIRVPLIHCTQIQQYVSHIS